MKRFSEKLFLFLAIMLMVCWQAFAGDIRTDVVIIGAGASGTSAALSAESKGVKTVLIEKAAFPAGAGTFAGGMFAADSSQQKREHRTVSKEWLYNLYTERSNYYANSRLVVNIINNAGRAVDFLIQNGGQFALMDAGYGQYWNLNHPATLHGYQNGGGSVNIGRLQKTYKEKGGTLLFETKGLKIVKDSSGNVAGVLVENGDGEQYTIYAKAVIVATGGMAANQAMMKDLLKTDNPPIGPVEVAQGEGIQMALAAGAEAGHVVPEFYGSNIEYQKQTPLADDPMLWNITDMPLYKVNNQGYRFMREDHTSEYHGAGNSIFMQPNHQAWIIVDQTMVNSLRKKGLSAIVADQYNRWKHSKLEYYEFNERDNFAENAKNWESPLNIDALFNDAISGGAMVKADSLAELASKMGVDPKVLIAETDRYNKFAKNGNDEDFHNISKMMYPVKNGPFYALHIVSRVICTLGGITVNEKLQALDMQSNPIPGLYVVGNDATGMYGNSYIELEGGSLGFAYTSGMLAGENAAKFVK